MQRDRRAVAASRRTVSAGGRPFRPAARAPRPRPCPAPVVLPRAARRTKQPGVTETPPPAQRRRELCLPAGSPAGPRARRDRACSPSLRAAGPVFGSSTARSAPSLGTMGPRWLLLVAAGLSLCGPLLSARTRGLKPGEHCPRHSVLGHPGSRSPGLRGNGAGGRRWDAVRTQRAPQTIPSVTASSRSRTDLWTEIRSPPLTAQVECLSHPTPPPPAVSADTPFLLGLGGCGRPATGY